MIIKVYKPAIVLSVLLITCSISAQQTHDHSQHQARPEAAKTQADKKTGDAHSDHLSGVNSRGDHAMGFSHATTTHRFRLTATGGSIEVSAKDKKDAISRDQIRTHLSHITKLFKEGDFDKPMFTHGKIPPGVPALIRLKAEVNYTYEETEQGAKVKIVTSNTEALSAVHEFLRFQIKDHETGDTLEIGPEN